MTNVELFNSKMAAIANEIREMSGTENSLSLDAMASNVSDSNDEITLQKELLEQAVAALEGKVSPELYAQGYADGYEAGEVAGVENFVNERPFVLTGMATTVPDWGFQNIPASFEIDLPYLTTFSGGAFYGCKKLTKVNCPLATKGNASTFYTCAKLTDVYLPKYQSVGSYEFYGCTSLEVLDLPLVKDLWSHAFSGCTNLKKLILRLPNGCSLRELSAFNNTPIASGTGFIYVPDNLVEQYKEATNWSTYASQIKPISELEE